MTKTQMMANFDDAAFGVAPINMFASTEGLVGHTEPGGQVFTFATDTCIAECVDDAGQPVPDGTTSSRVLVTNLHNRTQPLIRYELADRFTPAGPAPPGSSGRQSTAGPMTGSATVTSPCILPR